LSNGGGLDFELLGGQSSSILENYLDVTENWWGTVDQVGDRELVVGGGTIDQVSPSSFIPLYILLIFVMF